MFLTKLSWQKWGVQLLLVFLFLVKRLDQVIFQVAFQPGLFCDSSGRAGEGATFQGTFLCQYVTYNWLQSKFAGRSYPISKV